MGPIKSSIVLVLYAWILSEISYQSSPSSLTFTLKGHLAHSAFTVALPSALANCSFSDLSSSISSF